MGGIIRGQVPGIDLLEYGTGLQQSMYRTRMIVEGRKVDIYRAY